MFIFPQVKNKPWIPWVYTWIWHCREQYSTPFYRAGIFYYSYISRCPCQHSSASLDSVLTQIAATPLRQSRSYMFPWPAIGAVYIVPPTGATWVVNLKFNQTDMVWHGPTKPDQSALDCISGCTKVGTSKWEVGWPTDPIIVYLFLSEVSRRRLIQVLEREVWLSADHWKDRNIGRRRWSPGMSVRLWKLQLMKLHRQAPASRKNATVFCWAFSGGNYTANI